MGLNVKWQKTLAVRRKNRQISTKSRKKLTVKIFLLIATERNSALAVKCPKFQTMTVKARPIETLLKLVTIWRSSDIFIAQINILFFTRVTLAICIHLSFTGFISVSCFWFMYVTRSSHGR